MTISSNYRCIKYWLLSLIFLAEFSHAFSNIKIASYDIPAIIQADGKGEYDKIFQQVNGITDSKLQYQVLPPARVDIMFNSKQIDCILPFDKKFHEDANTINSMPFSIAQAYIYSAKGTQALTLNQLKNKKVGARLGMLYGPEFDDAQLNVEYVSYIEQNIDKLNAGRIDAFVAWAPDSIQAFKNKSIGNLPHTKSFIRHNDAFLCHDTIAARKFIKTFNRGLKILHKYNIDKQGSVIVQQQVTQPNSVSH